MEISPELLAELRNWITELGLSKYEVFLVFIVCLIAWRLPAIFSFLKEMRVINLDAKHKRLSLEAKIKREKERRRKSKRKK